MFEVNGKYTSATIHATIVENEAISQISDLCNHPVFEGANIVVMPDVHAGAGCTIGTTVKLSQRKIIPNIVGVDISCGIMTTMFTANEIDFKSLDTFIKKNVPAGMDVRKGRHRNLNIQAKRSIEEILEETNIGNIEYHIKSVGSLGGGNHFIEIGHISENRYALMVHTGSRNLGKKVCEYFQQKAIKNMLGEKAFNENLQSVIDDLKKEGRHNEIAKTIANLKANFSPIKQICSKDLAWIEGNDFDAYIRNMIRLQNVAHENRRLISQDIINYLGVEVIESFDTTHNYVEQRTDGDIVIRKGAIRAEEGEKVVIPLNMRDGVIIATGKGNNDWNKSAPHGAGRLMSRSKAKEQISLDEFKDSMKGINTWSVNNSTIDEAPQAYKPMKDIVDLISPTVDIVEIIKPIYNFKSSKDETPAYMKKKPQI